jgi:hypothetical protein
MRVAEQCDAGYEQKKYDSLGHGDSLSFGVQSYRNARMILPAVVDVNEAGVEKSGS